MRKKILLTGGSGFIGKNLIEQLSGRYDFIAPRHRELELMDEQAVRAFFLEQKPDMVIHSATKPGHRNALDPTNIAITNLHMFSNLFEASRRTKVEKFLFLGSGSEFDMRNYRPAMKEESLGEWIPEDDTGFSKYVCSRMLSGNPGYVNVRFFGIYGKYEDYAIRFISNAIAKAILDLPITLRQDRKFSYTYVSDGVRAIGRFLDTDVSELRYNEYNVTPPEPESLFALARLVVSISAKPELPILVESPGEGIEYSGDSARFMEQFPDFRFTDTQEAVRELYMWYENHKDELDRSLLITDK